jgi:hypothetical protein
MQLRSLVVLGGLGGRRIGASDLGISYTSRIEQVANTTLEFWSERPSTTDRGRASHGAKLME